MKFLIDASSDARLAVHLAASGHDATRVGRDHPRDLPDREVLAIAHREGRILVTDDRDFGELIFRLRQPHAGVTYLRLETTVHAVRIARLDAVLASHNDRLDCFLVVDLDDVQVRGDRSPERE